MRLSFLFQHNLLCRVKTASANSTFLLPTGEEHTDLTRGGKNCCVDLKICEKLLIFQHASLHLYLHLFFCILVYGCFDWEDIQTSVWGPLWTQICAYVENCSCYTGESGCLCQPSLIMADLPAPSLCLIPFAG